MARKEITLKPPRNPWDRQPQETDPAWKAFANYRDQGLTRSIYKTADQLNAQIGNIKNWSAKHKWRTRATAYDIEQDRQDQIWLAQERRKALKKHVQQAQALQSVWIRRLQTLNPDDLTPSETLRFAEIATKLERDALQLTDPTIVNVNVTQIETLDLEDTRERLQQIRQEIDERLHTPQLVATEEQANSEVIDAEIVEE